MIRKIHNYKPQTNPWHREKEPHNRHETLWRQTKQATSSLLPTKMIAKLKWSQNNVNYAMFKLELVWTSCFDYGLLLLKVPMKSHWTLISDCWEFARATFNQEKWSNHNLHLPVLLVIMQEYLIIPGLDTSSQISEVSLCKANMNAIFSDFRYVHSSLAKGDVCRLLIVFANSLGPDQARQNVGPDLGPNCLTLWWYSWMNFSKKLILKKNQQTTKNMKKYPAFKELNEKPYIALIGANALKILHA